MKLQQYLLNHYLHVPFEEFSHKAVSALGILVSIKHNPMSQDSGNSNQKDIDAAITRVREIIAITDKKIEVSLYILDRNIAPQDFTKNPTLHIIKFTRNKKVNDSENITMNSDQIQQALCKAIEEINEILMKCIAGFSEQMFFDEAGSL